MADDADILSRRWILIDVDAGQPSGTNSTDQEHLDTLAVAKTVIKYLTDRCFPTPALTDSGNGHHVYVRVDLPNNRASEFLVRRFLCAIEQNFKGTCGTAEIDTSTYNAARLTKATGSFVYKGEDTPERPCRQSRIISKGDGRITNVKLLEIVASEFEMKDGGSFVQGVAIDDEAMSAQLDKLKEFLEFHSVEYHNIRMCDGQIVVACTCPNAESHTMDGGEFECVAMIAESGALSFNCKHNNCTHLTTWAGVKTFLEARTGKTFLWGGNGKLFIGGVQVLGVVEPVVEVKKQGADTLAAEFFALQKAHVASGTTLTPIMRELLKARKSRLQGLGGRTITGTSMRLVALTFDSELDAETYTTHFGGDTELSAERTGKQVRLRLADHIRVYGTTAVQETI